MKHPVNLLKLDEPIWLTSEYAEIRVGNEGRSHFTTPLGPFLIRQDPDTHAIWMALRIDERHINGQGFCHGGMLLTMADEVLGMNVFKALDFMAAPTVNLQTNFLKSVRQGELLEVTATHIRVTRTMAFAQGMALVDGDAVATMSAVFKRVKPLNKEDG